MWKHPPYIGHPAPITGRRKLLFSEGAQWKKRCAIFSSGFFTNHIMSRMSVIIDMKQRYLQALGKYVAENGVFWLEEETTKITIDNGKIVLDHDFQSFATQNDLVQVLRSTLA